MQNSYKAALCVLLLIPSLFLATPALAEDNASQPAAKEEKGLLDKLKFWGDDEKKAAPAADAAADKPQTQPEEEKGWLDKFKFWGNEDKDKAGKSGSAKPAAKPLPPVKPRPSGAPPVVNIEETTPAPEPTTDAGSSSKPVPIKLPPPKPKTSADAEPQVIQVDRIVAVVDNNVITRNELQERISRIVDQLEKQGTPLPPKDVLEKQMLERLIIDRLQLQLASQTGLRVDDNQLDKTLERIAAQNKLALPQFREALEKDGVRFGKFREDIRREIILARLKEREVDNRLTITDAEIDNLLTTQAARKDSDEYEIAHILIRAPEGGTPEELQKLRTKAEDALKKLQSGSDFNQVSASYSDAPNAMEGGSLGWKTSTQLPELFLNAVKNLQAGSLTPILRSPNGFHIIKLTNRRGGTSPMVVQQTQVRHILVKTSEIVSDQDAQHRMDDLKERLDNGGDFVELARLHSEDGSASKGGDLGWVSPGDMVPEFEKAMNELKPGEISEPVRSPFGWHIIQVIARRQQDMSHEAARLKARQEIKARKSDEAYQDWLRELRDRAFVEYHLEDKD